MKAPQARRRAATGAPTRRRALLIGLAVVALVLAGCGAAGPEPTSAESGAPGRDPRVQPFSSTSIWNTPIGSGAVYAPAGLAPLPGGRTDGRVPQIDDEPIILSPEAPEVSILFSEGAFGGDRCRSDPSRVLRNAPIPADYVLVMIGVRADGRKELVALADGYRRPPLSRRTSGPRSLEGRWAERSSQ